MRITKNALAIALLLSSIATGASGAAAASAGASSAVTSGTSSAVAAGTASASPDAAVAISYAEKQQGKPYLWGATGPDAFDCSGLTYMAWQQVHIHIGRTSQQQWADLPHISASELQPGDLIFYVGYLEPGEAAPGHVTMYIGDGQMVEAYATGYPVRITAVRPDVFGYARP